MNASHLCGFLLGRSEAIRAVAGNRATLGIGLVLVLTASIARNYDQTYLLADPWAPAVGLAVSLVSSLIIFCFVDSLCLKPSMGLGTSPGFWAQYRVFLGLFWMTAPIAWLYAIPAERFLPSRQAAIVNSLLLAIVSVWRVLLLPRTVSVLTGQPFGRVCGAVLLPASAEMFLVTLAAAFNVPAFMGGMIHSPEQQILNVAHGAAVWGALGTGALSFLLLIRVRRPAEGVGLAKPEHRYSPAAWLACVVIGWLVVAIVPQGELSRTHHVQHLLEQGRYRDALVYLSQHQKRDFAPAHRIPPDPYQPGVFETLPGLFRAMDGQEAAWVRQEYLSHLDVMLRHPARWDRSTRDHLALLEALRHIPEGSGWARAHQQPLANLLQSVSPDETNRISQIRDALDKLGVTP